MDQSFSTSQPSSPSYSSRGAGLALIGCATYMIAQLVMWVFPVVKALSIYMDASRISSRLSSSGNMFEALNYSLGVLGSAYDSLLAIGVVLVLALLVVIVGLGIYFVALGQWARSNSDSVVCRSASKARTAIGVKFVLLIIPFVLMVLLYIYGALVMSNNGLMSLDVLKSLGLIEVLYPLAWWTGSLLSYIMLWHAFRDIVETSTSDRTLRAGASYLSTAGVLGVWLRVFGLVGLIACFVLGAAYKDMITLLAVFYIGVKLLLLAAGAYYAISGWMTLSGSGSGASASASRVSSVGYSSTGSSSSDSSLTGHSSSGYSSTSSPATSLRPSSSGSNGSGTNPMRVMIAALAVIAILAVVVLAYAVMSSSDSKHRIEQEDDIDADNEEYMGYEDNDNSRSSYEQTRLQQRRHDAIAELRICVEAIEGLESYDEDFISCREAAVENAFFGLNDSDFTSDEQLEIDRLRQRLELSKRLLSERIALEESGGEGRFIDYDEPYEEVDASQEVIQPESTAAAYSEDDTIYEAVEHNAEFPGGDAACMRWLSEHIQYPSLAFEQGIQGRVVVQFVVNRDGSIQEVKVLRSPDPLLSQEAERVVREMPKWKPARLANKTVRSRFNLPIKFTIR